MTTFVAIGLGYLTVTLLGGLVWSGLEVIFPEEFVTADGAPRFPATEVAIVMCIVHFFCAWLGGYVSASVASEKEIRHGLGLMLLLLVSGAINLFTLWGLQPVWYQVLVPLLWASGSVRGAKFRALKPKS